MEQLIIGFGLTVFGSAVGLIDKWKSKTENGYKKSNGIAVVLLLFSIGGGLIAFLAGITAIGSSKWNDKIAGERQQRIDSLGLLIYKSELANQNLIDQNLQYSKRLDSTTSLNYLLVNKITSQASQLSDYLSGKGSFCYFNLALSDPGLNRYRYELYSAGSNPMDNVVARIVDVFNVTRDGYGFVLHIGKVYPKIHTVRLFESTFRSAKKDSIWMTVSFQTNGREFDEELKAIFKDNKWVEHFEVAEEGRTLVNRTDPDFPRSWLK